MAATGFSSENRCAKALSRCVSIKTLGQVVMLSCTSPDATHVKQADSSLQRDLSHFIDQFLRGAVEFELHGDALEVQIGNQERPE